jgi:predicted ATPase
LARQLESSVDLAPPLAGLWLFHMARGQYSRSDKITDELFNVARGLDDPDILLQAHHCAWPVRFLVGAFTEAKTHIDDGLVIYDEVRHAKQRFLYLGHDPAVCGLSIKAVLQWLLGYPTQGIGLEREMIDLARRLQHSPSLAHALWFACMAQMARGDVAAVINTANELVTLSEEHALSQPRAIGLAYLGWAVGQTEDFPTGVRYLEEALVAWDRLGLRTYLSFVTCLLADTYSAGRQYQKGLEQANSAIALASEIGDRWCVPWIHMIRARLLQQTCADSYAIEESLRTAIGIAQFQRAKGWELRAAGSLARLRRDQGKRDEARELLAQVYGWFTEGFDTRDLKEAKALLEELAA